MVFKQETDSETVAFYLKMLKSIYGYSIRKISCDIDVGIDTLYSITGGRKASKPMNYYIMFMLRKVYPNEMIQIDIAAVAFSEGAKEENCNVYV